MLERLQPFFIVMEVYDVSYCPESLDLFSYSRDEILGFWHDSRQPVNRSVNVSLGIQYVVYELNDPPYV
jgi:hypothetical protein